MPRFAASLGRLTALLALAGLAAPVLPLALWSAAAAWPWPALLPTVWSLRSWQLLQDSDAGLWDAVGTSLAIASVVTCLALLISLPLARVVGQGLFRGKAALEAAMLMPLLLPSFVAAMGLHESFLAWGVTDTIPAVVLMHLIPTTPYMLRTLATAFALLGQRQEDQARSLGANPRQVLWHVTLPRLLPAVLLGCTFVFVASLGEYLLTLLIGGGMVTTLPVVLYPYIAAGDRSVAAMGSLLLAAGPLAAAVALSWILRRHPAYLVEAKP